MVVISPSQHLSAAVAAHSLAIAFTERAHHEGNERLAAHWAAQAGRCGTDRGCDCGGESVMTPGRLSEILRTSLPGPTSQTRGHLGVRRTTSPCVVARTASGSPTRIAAALEEIVAVVAILYT